MGLRGWNRISPPPPAPAPKSYQALYHEAVVAEFGQAQPLASALAPDLLAQLGRMETNRAGWQFKSAECDNRGACRGKWNREGGTFVDFDLAAPKDWRPIHFDADGLNLETIGPAVNGHARVTQNAAPRWAAVA